MKRDLARIAADAWDVAIVGGGIYGVCAAHEAALRGLSVCLLERGDFGGGTSSQSLKVVHGGLRYLQHGDVARTLESIRERRTLLRIAPGIVRPMACVMPTYGHGLRGREVLGVGVALGDLVGLRRNVGVAPGRRIPRGQLLSRADTLARCPGIERLGLTGGALWWDALSRSTERLLLAFLRTALSNGAAAANHVAVTGLLRDGAAVTGVRARDELTGEPFDVRAKLVLNAAGPFVDDLLATLGHPPRTPLFPQSKALNLVTRRSPPEVAVAIASRARFEDRDALLAAGSRLFFVVPWRGLTLLGTRHLPWDGRPETFRVTEADVATFLGEVNAAWPGAGLVRDDVIGVYGGILPRTPTSGAADEVQLAKHATLVDHGRRDGIPGLVTVVGVKWTTARGVAETTVEHLAAQLGRVAGPRLGRTTPLIGAALGDDGGAHDPERARTLAALARTSPALGTAVHHASRVTGAELVYAAREELAQRLDDVWLRRTELYLERPLDCAAIARSAELMGDELGWSEGRRADEIARCEAALRRFAGSGER